MKALNTIIGSLVLVSATAFSAPSEAVSLQRVAINHAAAVCLGTTPNYQNMLFTRPQGVSNSSQKIAVIACGGISTPLNGDGSAAVLVYETGLNNLSNKDITVNCSLVDGLVDGSGTVATVFPRTVIVPAGGVNWIDWYGPTDNAGKNFTYPSMTCQMPPSTEVTYTATLYYEDVGQ